ncbi:unnamed protein product [Ectocarpus sp. 12 AP-2014]
MRSTNGSSCWWRRLLVSLCVQTREQARHVRPPNDGFACAFACTANKLNLVLSLLLTVVVCDGQTKWHGPHGLSELPQTKENEHRSPSDKGRHALGRNGGCYPLATNTTVSLKSCPRVADSKLGHVVRDHRTYKFFHVEIGLPLNAFNESGS